MDVTEIVRTLKQERRGIDKALRALGNLNGNKAGVGEVRHYKKRGHRMSAATKRKLSRLAKARWAEKRG